MMQRFISFIFLSLVAGLLAGLFGFVLLVPFANFADLSNQSEVITKLIRKLIFVMSGLTALGVGLSYLFITFKNPKENSLQAFSQKRNTKPA